jgi:hypothetical protein
VAVFLGYPPSRVGFGGGKRGRVGGPGGGLVRGGAVAWPLVGVDIMATSAVGLCCRARVIPVRVGRGLGWGVLVWGLPPSQGVVLRCGVLAVGAALPSREVRLGVFVVVAASRGVLAC